MGERIGFGPRFLAVLIDGVVICIMGGILGSVLGGLFGVGAGAVVGAGEPGAAALGGVFGALAGAFLGTQLLSLVWIVWEGLTGAALGKMLLKIRIKSDTGATGTPDKLLLRAAVKYSSSLLGLLGALTGIGILLKLGNLAGLVIFIGCFFVLSANRQALHDLVAKTAVYRD